MCGTALTDIDVQVIDTSEDSHVKKLAALREISDWDLALKITPDDDFLEEGCHKFLHIGMEEDLNDRAGESCLRCFKIFNNKEEDLWILDDGDKLCGWVCTECAYALLKMRDCWLRESTAEFRFKLKTPKWVGKLANMKYRDREIVEIFETIPSLTVECWPKGHPVPDHTTVARFDFGDGNTLKCICLDCLSELGHYKIPMKNIDELLSSITPLE
jgi:hypothetical protein